jgi:acyl carrier protein
MVRFWREVLGIEEPGRDDRFLESGGDSISATRLVARMNEEFGCQISVLAFFQSPTIASLAEMVAKKQGEAIASRNLDQVLDELESLSEAEAERLLSEPDRPAPENRE